MKNVSLKLLLMISFLVPHLASSNEPEKTLKPKTASMGMGLNGISDWSTQMPFIDLMKQSRDWNDWRDKTKARPPIHTNENDWVTKLSPGQTAGTVFLTSPKDRDPIYIEYVVNFDGEGEIEYRWATKLQAKASKPGHHIIKVGRGNNLIEIVSTNPQNPIRNISIVPKKHYKAFKNGDIFNPDWVSLISQFNTLRYMDWLKTNNSTLSKWSERPKVTDRTWRNGVPLEIIAELAKQTNTHLWVNVPHLADKKYISKMASTLKANLPSHLDIYVEHSNEVWNWQFKQAHHANKEGRKIFGEIGPAFMRWHGMRTAQICNIFKQNIFEGEKDRVHCVLGVQTAWHGLEKQALECEGWKENQGKACYKHGIDHIAVTSYFSGKLSGPKSKTENQYYETLANWAKKPEGINLAFEQLKSGKPLSNINKDLSKYKGAHARFKSHMDYWTATSKSYGLSLVAYEGGQHITANGRALQNDKNMTEFYEKLNDDNRMGGIYLSLMELWKSSGGELNVHFVDVSYPSKWGSWGARKYLDTTSPKWDAIEKFNKNNDCWWKNCSIER